jgi:light-regulated signal transduction histidine kinase (bacteriophytochrome)
MNLVSNALKYTSKKLVRIIEIGSSVTTKEITCFIKDNDAGFDMTYSHKMFGVFQRLHSQKEFKGTGIGLAIVKRIVNLHSGNK